MNEEKKVPFKWEYGEETISLQLGMYANNQRLYIGMITHTEDGAEAFADMTVNLPGYSLDPGEAFISGDISKDLLRFIKENKLGKVLPYQVQSGYGKYSAVAFDLEKLKAFDPKGVAEFRKEWNLPDKKPESPANFEELLKLLQESGCEVSKRGKSYRLKLPGWEKAARMDSLGEGYGLEDLQAVLSGKKAHTPRKKVVAQAEPPKVNLLVDIQAKLQAGKGAGYARWAKVFNLKQMAQTMNYLSENNLLEYAILEEKAAAATAHHNELSAQIKAAEKRMAEIAVLRTHIVNYAKTREVYVAYRKAGYSKKFREEHEKEILLHQAAKNAFDEMGVKKLPKVKELQTEYAKLLEEKKKTYAEYRRSREEMRELLTAKANVDRVLKMEVEQDVEKEKDHGQR